MTEISPTRRRKNGTKCPTFGQRRNGSRYTTKCDHDPARPRLELVRPWSSKMHPVIRLAIERCDRIYTQPHRFPELTFDWLSRARRSQRLEAIALVAKAEFLRMDLASHRVGEAIPGTPYLAGIPITQVAAWTGLTPWRAARALSDLTYAGYQTGKLDKRGRLCAPQPIEQEIDPVTRKRIFRARAAVRKYSDTFVSRLGLTSEVDDATEWAANKRKQQAERDAESKAEVARIKRAQLRAIHEARILDQGSADAKAAAAARLADAATAKKRLEIQLDVWREFTDSTPEARRAEAERRLHLTEWQRTKGPPE